MRRCVKSVRFTIYGSHCKVLSSIISFGRTLNVFKIALCCCVSADELMALNTVEKVKWLKALCP